MNNIKNSDAAKDDDDSSCSSFSRFPDEIVFDILSRLINLKTLCFCKLVSKRFNRIVLQVESIVYHALSFTESRSLYVSPVTSMKAFTRVKSLRLQLLPIIDFDNTCSLFKWKIKFEKKLDLFLFISPIYVDEKFNAKDKFYVASQCFEEVVKIHGMMLGLINDLPLLEKLSITDSGKKGSIYVTGGKIAQLRENGKAVYSHERMPECDHWLLDYPVSGIVTRGVTFILFNRNEFHMDNDGIIEFDDHDDDDYYDDFEDACREVVKKNLKTIRI